MSVQLHLDDAHDGFGTVMHSSISPEHQAHRTKQSRPDQQARNGNDSFDRMLSDPGIRYCSALRVSED